jgi:hypothetical protein
MVGVDDGSIARPRGSPGEAAVLKSRLTEAVEDIGRLIRDKEQLRMMSNQLRGELAAAHRNAAAAAAATAAGTVGANGGSGSADSGGAPHGAVMGAPHGATAPFAPEQWRRVHPHPQPLQLPVRQYLGEADLDLARGTAAVEDAGRIPAVRAASAWVPSISAGDGTSVGSGRGEGGTAGTGGTDGGGGGGGRASTAGLARQGSDEPTLAAGRLPHGTAAAAASALRMSVGSSIDSEALRGVFSLLNTLSDNEEVVGAIARTLGFAVCARLSSSRLLDSRLPDCSTLVFPIARLSSSRLLGTFVFPVARLLIPFGSHVCQRYTRTIRLR